MDASLDTNVIIHLYRANLQHVLFGRFQKLKVYEFIRSHEMIRHAGPDIIGLFDSDVKAGRIDLITDEYLRSISMLQVFLQHVNDLRILFGGSDLGEVYAIALAKTLGCMCLVTDDVTERGPHYTLMRIPDSEVIPFAFYEILFLDYLEGRIDEHCLQGTYDLVCSLAKFTWSIESRLKRFIRRFWSDPYSKGEKSWMGCFCRDRGIDAKDRIKKLWEYILKAR